MSAASKRTFLFRVFHPLGPHVCASLGMPGASEDVDALEWNNATASIESVPDSYVSGAIHRARWVIDALLADEVLQPIDMTAQIGEGVMVCPDCGEENAVITLQEILVKFYLAMRLEERDGQLVR